MIKKSFKTFLYLAIFFFLSQSAFALNLVELSPGYYPNSSRGRALSSADIYVGKPDLDPEIVANQKTLSVQQEDGTIVAVTQPIHTNAGGVPQYLGSPVTLLVEGDYSLKVLDSSGVQVYYVPSTAYEQYLVAGNYYYPDYAEADQGVVGGGETVTDILADVGIVTNATMYFSHNSGAATTTYTFTTNTTITDNFNIIIEQGAIIEVATGKILTTSKNIEAGLYPVFNCVGTGSVIGLMNVNSLWFGDTGDGVTDDSGAIQNAINATAEGGTITIPRTSSYHKITATQLSEALAVSTKINLVIDGELRATSHTAGVNPPYVIYVSADGVTISGSGTLRGNGSYVVNEGTPANRPGLLRLAADNITVSGLTFVNPQEVAVSIIGTNAVTVKNSQFTGGPVIAVATSPQHFYIDAFNNNRITVNKNRFYMDAALGSTRNAVNVNSDVGINITNNAFLDMHEHALYLSTRSAIITGNTIRYTQLAADQKGSAIVCAGFYNTISNNTIYDAALGGISITTGVGVIVANNTLYGVGFVGINVTNVAALAVGFNNITISGNYLQAAVAGTVYEGIRYKNAANMTAISYGGKIVNNILDGWGNIAAVSNSSITISGLDATYPIHGVDISGNTITGSVQHGIYLNYAHKIRIKDNYIYNNPRATFRAIYLNITTEILIECNVADDYQGAPTMTAFIITNAGTSDVWLLNNECYGASVVNPFGHSVARNVLGRGNRVSRTDNLVGTFTMNNVASLVVNNANYINATITDEIGFILITPLGSNSALVMGSVKALYNSAGVTGTSFTMRTSDNASVPATDHVFAYEIVQ